MDAPSQSRPLTILSQLLLQPSSRTSGNNPGSIAPLDATEKVEILAIANSHHVVVRGLQAFRDEMSRSGNEAESEWASEVIEKEKARIDAALPVLEIICDKFAEQGCSVIVIKSLDHWPDLGSDLDLFTNAQPSQVVDVMAEQFEAAREKRSWGDRLANKWNFAVPGLNELVEIHVGRLGQTGEQIAVAQSLVTRARRVEIGGHSFRVSSPEDRIIISTLQRMYRHFYLRLCDVVDTAQLIGAGAVDFRQLQSLSETAGIWKGVATFLVVVSDYVKSYRGEGLSLPPNVIAEAEFGSDQLTFRGGFLRIPIAPHSMRLYATELMRLMRNGEVEGSFRLSLLPGLATAALVGERLTGTDKGIW